MRVSRLGNELHRPADGHHNQALDRPAQKSSRYCVFSTLIQMDAGSKKIEANFWPGQSGILSLKGEIFFTLVTKAADTNV